MNRELLKYIYQEEIYLIERNDSKMESGKSTDLVSHQSLVVILVDPGYTSHSDFLEKILSSVELGMENVKIISDTENKSLLSNFHFEKCISFGIPIPISTKLKAYEITEIEGRKFLLADSLTAISSDKTSAKKRKLWNELKALF